MKYNIVRSKRKTISLVIKNDCTLEVRSPYKVSDKIIDEFVKIKKDWIEKALKRQSESYVFPEFPEEIFEEIRKETLRKTENYLKDFPGEKPELISIRKQRATWGSCNSHRKITINALAGLLPEKLFEYIMIHELCHLVYMNHSTDFWKLVSYYLPSWKSAREELKKYRL